MDRLQAEIEKQIQIIKMLIEKQAQREQIRQEREKLDNLLNEFLKEK
ncbi:MAG: hypothetical protein ACLU84_05480 [Clostridia bacterium]